MLEQMGIAAKAASYKLALLSSREKIAYWKPLLMSWKRKRKASSARTYKMLSRREPTA